MIGSFGAISFGEIAGIPGGYCVISFSTGSFSASRMATMRVPWMTLPAPTAMQKVGVRLARLVARGDHVLIRRVLADLVVEAGEILAEQLA